jgi:hypothetical protein
MQGEFYLKLGYLAGIAHIALWRLMAFVYRYSGFAFYTVNHNSIPL